MRHLNFYWLAAFCALALGCSQDSTPPMTSPPAIQSDAGTAIAAAIASTERLPGDTEEDARRQPQAVLEFLDVEPGMRVLDFLAGGGYYTELLSRIVGPDGTVIAYNNAAYTRFFGDRMNERLAGGRLANVRLLQTEPNELAFEPGELDAALFVMSYHDLYHRPDEGEASIDVAGVVATIYQAMKAGGIVLVQDHSAAPDADVIEAADSLHRIDPEVVKRDFTAVGFTFDGESSVFANPGDDRARGVFDDAIRGRTDRFMVRFRKPLPADAPRME